MDVDVDFDKKWSPSSRVITRYEDWAMRFRGEAHLQRSDIEILAQEIVPWQTTHDKCMKLLSPYRIKYGLLDSWGGEPFLEDMLS